MTQSLMPEFPDWSRLFFKPALTRFTPPTRPMDNMALSPDVPQEDEFAMANMTDAAFYHAWVFPRNGRLYFHRYALLENISEKERDQWKRTYRKLIRNVTVSGNGRRPILKNPVNTGRIKALLEIFPQAKFIYMIRNPYRVFPSTLNLHKKMLAVSSLQSISDDDITENIFLFYEKLLKKYLSEKQLIPRGNLIEVRFEDLETDPLGQLRRIYHELSLPGFETAESQFRRHIERQENYRKNRYEPDLHSDKQIEIRWKFAFDHWGYDPRQ